MVNIVTDALVHSVQNLSEKGGALCKAPGIIPPVVHHLRR